MIPIEKLKTSTECKSFNNASVGGKANVFEVILSFYKHFLPVTNSFLFATNVNIFYILFILVI